MKIKLMKKITKFLTASLPFIVLVNYNANSTEISSITSGRNAAGAFEIQIGGTKINKVSSYSLNNPSRIVIDIPRAKSNLTNKSTQIAGSFATNVVVLEGANKVRATINLNKNVPYNVVSSPNKISVVLKGGARPIKNNKVYKKSKQKSYSKFAKVDFKRGDSGQGRVLIRLPNNKANVSIDKVGSRIVAKLKGAVFGRSNQLNVLDFGTPVKTVDVLRRHLTINTKNDKYEVVSYQNDKVFTIELALPSQESKMQDLLPPGDSKKQYDGETLSLNFQNIEVRAVLQLIGDFTNTNIVVSDDVSGSITLRLNDVPWDQALDIILQTKGLSMQKNGSVMYIASSETIAKNKKAAYTVSTVEQDLAPLQQQLISIRYARAEDLKKIIVSNSASKGKDSMNASSVLSSRGSLTADARTNTLIVNDVPSNIDKVRQLISNLDIAVKQVMIDARVVIASNDFSYELGAIWKMGSNKKISTGEGKLANKIQDPNIDTGMNARLGVNKGFPILNVGSLATQILGSDFLLDLELSALESDGRGEVLSSPRVITQDGFTANISQGVEVTMPAVGDNTKPEKVKAELTLDVTPKIAPNDMVDMILSINKDSLARSAVSGGVSVNTNRINTKVLVQSGETVVLGGVYTKTKNNTVAKVPFFGDLPLIGRAFRKDSTVSNKNELLIFVTPKIVNNRYTSRDKFSQLRK